MCDPPLVSAVPTQQNTSAYGRDSNEAYQPLLKYWYYTESSSWKAKGNNQAHSPYPLINYKAVVSWKAACVFGNTRVCGFAGQEATRAPQGPLAGQSCSAGSQSTTEEPLRRHHLSFRPKRFFESFKRTDVSTASLSSCLGLQYF